ncbi:GtrA family protein [Wenzhouxiangella sp. XN79A]|uniref:GtrA family protein n=1 Tax=Wenzhouxiangella sp. XN79A TaxID=2724193 RepID=UPI00144AF2AA|nr:GtrA family protein [Wenzhouxiangella sp. XN79A]
MPPRVPIAAPPDSSLIQRVARSTSSRATFLRFACVGGTIAIIDAGLLYLLKDLPGFNVYTARLVSYFAAMCAGYFLNRYFTFHHLERGRVLWDELLRFFSVHALGGALNFAVYALVVTLADRMGATGRVALFAPLAGVWVGGVVGMCFNFLMSRKHVFDGRTR